MAPVRTHSPEPASPVSAPIVKNVSAPGVEEYYPRNDPLIGTPFSKDDYPQNKYIPKLFQPLTIRNTTFKNRIWVSPMCQYSAIGGHMTDWHLVHLGGFATRGVGSIMLEATAVAPNGRITPEDAGIWTDTQIAPMKRIVDFIHAQGTVVGIQLSHAGRKSSTIAPWISAAQKKMGNNSMVAQKEQGGWEGDVVAPSAIAFGETYPQPREMSLADIGALEKAYVDAVERCKLIGFDFIEIHGAHGYLLHSFCSPHSNARTDMYGGSLDNRLRLPLRIVRSVRQAWGEEKPLFYRLSGSDWAEGPEMDQITGEWRSWGIEQNIELSKRLAKLGVDMVDVSSGGNWKAQKIPVGPMYQVPFAEQIKKEVSELVVGSVGLITTPQQAEGILQEGKADVLMLGREMLRHADFALDAAKELGAVVKPANQYERAWTRMMSPREEIA
ncbi:FMN-linked oxidoreductase [Ceratobasidium sp. AG-I]|nr:FMN-linked oxidoreductase [Ceratobasidium sp. AG-I]